MAQSDDGRLDSGSNEVKREKREEVRCLSLSADTVLASVTLVAHHTG